MSDIIDRFKQIRKMSGLNQTDFGSSLNLKQSTIASYECGARPLTDRVISDICSVYSIDELWFRTGEGDPHPKMSEYEEISKFVEESLADRSDDIKKRLLLAFSRLDADGWKAVETLVDQLSGRK